MSESQLLSTKKLKDEEFKTREIRIIYMNGDVTILSATVNIIKDTLEDLYDKIQIDTDKVNITGMIVNKCVYNHKHKHLNSNKNYINTLIIMKTPILSTFLKDFYKEYNDENYIEDYNKDLIEDYIEDYNKDYIEVSLILGSYFPYIKSILRNYYDTPYSKYKNDADNNKLINKKAKISFISSLSKLNNNCIPSDDYDLIEIYLIKKSYDSIFLLNEIEKYLTIN